MFEILIGAFLGFLFSFSFWYITFLKTRTNVQFSKYPKAY